MQTKNLKKKGFTLVELVVVVAVIAVLSAILIPTIGCFVEQAKETNDMATVRLLNTALVEDEAENGKSATMTDALAAMAKKGYLVDKLTPRSTGEILWDSLNNRFALYKDGQALYRDNTTEEIKGANLWKVLDTEGKTVEQIQAELTKGEYSYYLKGNSVAGTFNVSTGLDVGENTGVTAVRYENTSATAKNVIICTNDFDTVITVNAEKDVVKHYGDVKEVNIVKVAPSSYHEFGTVANNINVAYGKVELETGAVVSNVVVKELENVVHTSENVKVAVSNGAKADYVISEVSGVLVAVEGAGASNVSKLEDVSGKAVAIGTKTYDTIENAWTELTNNDSLLLLADCNTTATLYIPENTNVTIDLNGHNITSSARVFYINQENSSLEVKGVGTISTTQQVVFGMIGSATDDGKTYTLKVNHGVKTSSAAYGIAVFAKKDNSSYGIDVVFEGDDESPWGSVYINGTVNKKVGNIPSIKFVNTTVSSMYLAGFSKFSAVNCTFNTIGSLKIKAGDIYLANNTINVDCSVMNNLTPDYVSNGNGAFAAKCGILFENGNSGYAGLGSIKVESNNTFNFINNGNIDYVEAMYIDYTQDTSFDIQIEVRYLQISDFKAKIQYIGKTNEDINCSGYIYFISEEEANAYTQEMFKQEYSIYEITTFGSVEKI